MKMVKSTLSILETVAISAYLAFLLSVYGHSSRYFCHFLPAGGVGKSALTIQLIQNQ